ncbi:hypothetical protein [Pyrobaculum aerophilum]|uniref:Uncharacterized protein n=1 Tax=Pyrobaculum aerophilum TaxID=13773 RepID=A0A371QU88_9CREN|nr:hypothetical protein [Pyrobaculum aerophilum]RFA92822.1 hypothetical protein CGL51_13850 [Pyrobaculum aerophilum]
MFESAAAVYGRERVVEAVKQLRRELEPYSTTVTLGGREHELILFKTGEAPFTKAVAYVLLEELAKRAPEVRERHLLSLSKINILKRTAGMYTLYS